MKIQRSETHDRLKQFTSQGADISKTCQDIIDRRPFGEYAFYIFAHKREIGLDERIAIFNSDLILPGKDRTYNSLEQVPTARLIWQPRLTKPKAQENSMLFKAHPGKDEIRVIWMIPARELWDQYTKGKMLENQTVCESIHNFQHNKEKLEAKESDDLSDGMIDAIYISLCTEANTNVGARVRKERDTEIFRRAP